MILNSKMLELLDDSSRDVVRELYGSRATWTAEECTARATARLEKEEQSQFAAWCDRNALPADWSATHKKTTKRPGWPDFTLAWGGRVLFVEFKMPWGRLSEAQRKQFALIVAAGNRLEISASAEQAKGVAREYLGLSF